MAGDEPMAMSDGAEGAEGQVIDVEGTIALYRSALVNKPTDEGECIELQRDLNTLVERLRPVLLAVEPIAPIVPRLADFS